MSQENATGKQPLIRPVNRQQMSWRAVDVERLIEEDHLARAIWTLVGRLNLSAFYQGIESSAEEGGRPAFDPQLLISLWVYAYTQEIGSAREVARRWEFDPAFQWLTGLDEVNYHTLADFRVEKQEELDELFTQVLAALSKEGLITLEQVMQDDEDSRNGEPTKLPVGKHQSGTLGPCAAACGGDGRPAERRRHPESEASARQGAAGTAGALGKGPWGAGKVAGKEAGEGAHQRHRTGSAKDEIARWRIGAWLQRTDFRGCGTRVDCGCRGNTGSQRHGPVASRGGTHRRTVAAKAGADGGRRGLYHASGHRRDGRTKDRFSWEYASRRRDHGEDRSPPAASECFRFSARDESLCVSRGQVAAAPRTSQQQEAGGRHLSVRGQNQRLSTLRPQTRMLSGKSEPRPRDFTSGGERRRSSLPAEDGNRRSAGELPSAWKSRGILSCVDQEQAGPASVSRAWPSEGANGNAVGLPHV